MANLSTILATSYEVTIDSELGYHKVRKSGFFDVENDEGLEYLHRMFLYPSFYERASCRKKLKLIPSLNDGALLVNWMHSLESREQNLEDVIALVAIRMQHAELFRALRTENVVIFAFGSIRDFEHGYDALPILGLNETTIEFKRFLFDQETRINQRCLALISQN